MKDREDYINTLELDNAELRKENQELKKQLEDKEDYINKLQATKDKLNKWDKENAMQQKEFIKYLEDEINVLNIVNSASFGLSFENEITRKVYQEILQKYKEIIGDDK